MSKPKLILIGAGGHARSCIDVIEQQDVFQIAGFVGLPDQKKLKYTDCGYSIIGTDEDLPELAKTYEYAFITLGQIQTADSRIGLYEKINSLEFRLPIIVSPAAHVSRHATIGAGTIVMHGAIVNAGANIGINCIINSCALIEHDVRVGNHCHISTGAIINGNTTIGDRSFLGSRSVIKQGLVIREDSVIGMGFVVRHNLEDRTHFKGKVHD
jgi:sugar O-acyltransferase (sialic acid O-acetyltransferase NeuD family)